MKAPFNFTRFLPMAARLLGRGRLPTLLFAVAAKGSSQGNRLGKLKDDLKLLQGAQIRFGSGLANGRSGRRWLLLTGSF